MQTKEQIRIFSHVDSPRLPMPHIAIERNYESEDMYVKKAMIAPTSEFAAIPHKSILATEGFPSLVDILKISKEIVIPKMNAKKDIIKDA